MIPQKVSYPETRAFDPFKDDQRFQDEVYGEIFLNSVERDVIDAPEFQRLFRISQVGFVNLVYQTANHTRGQHAIGTCEVAKRLIHRLSQNFSAMGEWNDADRDGPRNESHETGSRVPPKISRSEAVLIRLGALLHDIGHGPFSHDIEKRTHLINLGDAGGNGRSSKPIRMKSYYGPYEKHDDFERNPTFYLAVMDSEHSVLARVLNRYSPDFWRLMEEEARDDRFKHIKAFVETVHQAKWQHVEREILASLLFHLLIFEKFPESAESFSQEVAVDYGQVAGHPNQRLWGLGPQPSWSAIHNAWYQPYRHDIIGNTLSADLVDYLARDLKRLGINRGMDLNLLNFYVLAGVKLNSSSQPPMNGGQLAFAATGLSPSHYYRCAIDLNDHKRGTVRDYLLNDVFRLLDLRHEIHEKGVNHRVVHSACAMLSRAVLMLEKEGKKPPLDAVVGLREDCPALFGEETFLRLLIEATPGEAGSMRKTNSIPQKLAERRVYRPLMIVPGDRAMTMLTGKSEKPDIAQLENTLRKLAAIVDSRFFAPFFLYMSMRVEEYLEHAVESIDEVLIDVDKAAHAPWDSSVSIADQIAVPKRVIIWTSPYKQLFKDPALLVKVGSEVTAIDDLQKQAQSSELQTFVRAAIQDAEIKYSRLWKLYVFMSDGLFYTGTLAKLIKDNQCGSGDEQHQGCLESAQRILLVCFRAAYDYFDNREASGNRPDLESEMNAKEFQEMLLLFLAERQRLDILSSDLLEKVSAVDVQLYLHSDDTTRCRDVRYKFDRDATVMWSQVGTGRKGSLESQAVRLLETSGVTRNRLLEREFREFIERYKESDESTQAKIQEALDAASNEELQLAARNGSLDFSAAYRSLYRTHPPSVDGK